MSGNFDQNIGGNDYTFDLDQRRSQVILVWRTFLATNPLQVLPGNLLVEG